MIMPTWFCSRATYNRVGGFDEGGKVRYVGSVGSDKQIF